NRSAAFGQRGVLIGGAFDLQLPTIDGQPGPSTSKPGCGSVGKIGLELFKSAQLGIDRGSEFSSRFSASIGLENRPEQGVIPVSAAVISNGSSDRFRDSSQILHQIADRLGCKFRMPFQSLVDIGDIGLVMLGVMD